MATCPEGTFLTGGHASAIDSVAGVAAENQVVVTQFIPGPQGYVANFDNNLPSGHEAFIFVDAICADADQVIFSANRRKRPR
jgi:hypothetical protein